MRFGLLIVCLAAVFSASAIGSPPEAGLSIIDMGAVADNTTINTKAIQSSIDRVASEGGGTITIPEGIFLSGAVFFKPGVNLHLEEGAVLRCTTDMKHFPEQRTRIEGHFEESYNPALINADGCDGLRITGKGTFDGAGRPIWSEFWRRRQAAQDPKNFKNLSIPRARLCIIENSRNVSIEGVTFKDSQFWNLHIYNCQDVVVKGARFMVPDDYRRVPSSDGIDIDSSQHITIKDCHFSVSDDCIALKGTKGPFALEDETSPPVEEIRVTGCTFKRGHSMVTCGSEATLVREVFVEDCKVDGAMPLLTLKLRPDTPQNYQGIEIRNILVNSPGATLFRINSWTQYFDLRGQPEPPSAVSDILMSEINGRIGSLGVIAGNPNTEFRNVTLANVDVQAKQRSLKIGDSVTGVRFREVRVNGRIVEP